MDTCPECREVEDPTVDLHLLGTRKENPDPWLRSSSMAVRVKVTPGSLSLTGVVRMVFHSPAYGITLICEEVPREYNEGGRVESADLEMMLS